MKKTNLILLAAVMLCSGAYSQKTADKTTDKTEKKEKKKSYFYGNPLGFFANNMEIGYEKDLPNNNSFIILAGFNMVKNGNTLFYPDNKVDRNGFTGELQYRVNLKYNPKEKQGGQVFSFFAPYLKAGYTDISETKYNYSTLYNNNNYYNTGNPYRINSIIRSFSGGMLFGLRFSSSEHRLSAAMYAGGGMKVSDVLGNQDYTRLYRSGYTGIIPRAGFQVGIAF